MAKERNPATQYAFFLLVACLMVVPGIAQPISTHFPPNSVVAPPYVQGPSVHSARMATRIVWSGMQCSGLVNSEMPFGFGPASACMKNNGGGWSVATCSNQTGLVTHYYASPSCTGTFSRIEASAIRQCRYNIGSMSYWADFCGSDYAETLSPSTPKQPILGDGSISDRDGALSPCPRNGCPPQHPFVTSFPTSNCGGSFNSSSLFHKKLALGKCLLYTSHTAQVNLQASCDKGLLIFNHFESGCDSSSSPLQTTVYPTNACVLQNDGTSASYSCGNP